MIHVIVSVLGIPAPATHAIYPAIWIYSTDIVGSLTEAEVVAVHTKDSKHVPKDDVKTLSSLLSAVASGPSTLTKGTVHVTMQSGCAIGSGGSM